MNEGKGAPLDPLGEPAAVQDCFLRECGLAGRFCLLRVECPPGREIASVVGASGVVCGTSGGMSQSPPGAGGAPRGTSRAPGVALGAPGRLGSGGRECGFIEVQVDCENVRRLGIANFTAVQVPTHGAAALSRCES